jgi:hypothetical protein
MTTPHDIPGPIGIAEERDRARDALASARDAWDAWQEAWRDLVGAMRIAGISTVRIDAYRVGSGYDEGGGQSLEGWLDEIEDALTEGDER